MAVYKNYHCLHLSLLNSVMGLTFLLLGRGHYTIDVLIAYYVTTRLWWMYHMVAETGHLTLRGGQNYLENEGWWIIAR